MSKNITEVENVLKQIRGQLFLIEGKKNKLSVLDYEDLCEVEQLLCNINDGGYLELDGQD